MQQKIEYTVAKENVENWLAEKKVPKVKLAENAENIELLIEGIQEGTIIINEDNSVTHHLLFPVKDKNGADVLTQLTYKARLQSGEIGAALKGVKSTDTIGMLNAYLSAATGEGAGMLSKLDSQDQKYCAAIGSFF